MIKLNLNKEIYEGWTVKAFIEELEPIMDMIMNNQSWQKPFTSKTEIKKYTMENQPYYKKAIPEVITYFCNKYNIQ